jgi:alpha-L-fucosidase
MGAPTKVAYLAINQREWATTQSRVQFNRAEDSARIMGYSIATSMDGTTWTTVIACATLPSVRAVQFIDLDVKQARFVKMTIMNNWSAPNLSKYFNNLKIDEMWVGSGYPGGGRAPLPLPDGPGCNAGAPLPGSSGTNGPPPQA